MKTAIKVIEQLQAAGFEAYMVGGAVRDFLLGKIPHDVDVATSAAPEQVKSQFARTADIGIEHGTVLVILDDDSIEVTTFRTEGIYSDNRRPDSVEFVQSLEEDLKRRDFTVNAMAMTKELDIIDLYGGKNDLENRLIRAVGNPDQRFGEDALRMLRAVRFTGQLDFAIDLETLHSIQKQAHLIKSIAVERLKIELDKIMVNQHTARSMNYLKKAGLTEFLPAGNLFEMDWENFNPTEKPVSGWLYMLYRQKKEVSDIREYKFSNEEKRLMEKALQAAREDLWDAWTFYAFSLKQLELAAGLLERKIDIEDMKMQLPIQSKSDLAATGRDLMEWCGQKQGPWLKIWIAKLEKQIVYGKLQNDKEQIRDWFMDEYHRHA